MNLRSVFTGIILVAALLVVSSAGPAFAKESAANTLAVCGCGMVFTPDAKTEYITAGDNSYACCSHKCHEMASKDPKAAGMMADAATADAKSMLAHTKMGVANVVAITEDGTKAVCGCGMEFSITDKTTYIHADGDSYACCGEECHKMASKDPAGAAKMVKDQLSKR
jgi:hypothetical protein